MRAKYKLLIEDTFIFGVGSIGSKLILFLLVPIYTNYMTDIEYGTADLVFTISQLIMPFISIVIFDAIIRFGLSKEERIEDVLLVGCIVFCFAAIVGLAIVPIIGIYNTLADWKWYVYFYIVCNTANSIELNYLKAKNRNKAYALLSVAQTGLMAALNILFLVYHSMGIKGYLLAYILSNAIIDIIAVILGNIISDLGRAHFDKSLFQRMVVYSSPLILNNVSWWVIHSSDKVMVEAMISAAALGIYTVSAKIPSIINVAVTVFQQAWGIASVREIESSNDKNYYSNVFKYYFTFVSGVCILLVSIVKIFMGIYVGDGFQEAWKYVPYLLVSAVFAAVASYYGSLYGALKKSVNNMLTTVLAAITNIIVNWITIPIIGIWGAAIGTLVSYIVIAIARMLDVGKYIDIPIDYKFLICNVIILLTHATAVSMDYHIYIASLIAIVLFYMVNKSNGKALIAYLIKREK